MSVDNLINTFGVSMEVYTRSESVDAGGALTKSYTATGTLILVYLQPSAPSESMLNGSVRMTTNFTAYINALDGSLNMATGTRLVDTESVVYEITGFRRPDMRSTPDTMAYYIASLVVVEGQS